MSELLPVVQLGASGVLLLVLLYLIRIVSRGDFVPRTTVDTLLNARDQEIERANRRGDAWHAAFEGERHVSELGRTQIRDLIEVARTVEHVMEALGAVAKEQGTDDA